MPSPRMVPIGERMVRAEDGVDDDVLTAIDAPPWVSQLCPLMPHQSVVRAKAPDWARNALEAMVRWNPHRLSRLLPALSGAEPRWDASDGLRYWRTGMMLNRCDPDSVEPLRRVEDGANPIKDWHGPPWAPNGIGIYFQAPNGKWWPTQEALDSGFQPCRSCSRRPSGL